MEEPQKLIGRAGERLAANSVRQPAHGRLLRAGAIWGTVQEAPISVWVEGDICKVVVLVVPEGYGQCAQEI